MDDLISRQDAIKAILEDGTWLESQGCKEITMEERKQRDADILSDLPSAQPEDKCGECDAWNQYKNYPRQRWIPVTEGLPKVNGEYLVTKVDHITQERQLDIAFHADFIHENNGFYKRDDVVAWMPIEPWKGADDE